MISKGSDHIDLAAGMRSSKYSGLVEIVSLRENVYRPLTQLIQKRNPIPRIAGKAIVFTTVDKKSTRQYAHLYILPLTLCICSQIYLH